MIDDLSDYESLSGVRTEFGTRPCTRVNNFLLGPSPDVVDLQGQLEELASALGVRR